MSISSIERESSVDESWFAEIESAASDVADMLQGSGLSVQPVSELVYDLVAEMLGSRFEEFFPITLKPAGGALERITMTFDHDGFRQALTVAANECLVRHGALYHTKP